jgi:hypothetical protein
VHLARRHGRPTLKGLQSVLDETVDGVESMASYVRSLAEPVHDLLDEAQSLAKGVREAVASYREIGSGAYAPAAETFQPAGRPS